MTPRDFFPHVPDEMFDMWLAPLIQEIGWPFSDLNASLLGSRWELLLSQIPLSTWYQLNWELSKIEIVKIKSNFNVATLDGIESIINHCAFGLDTPVANLPNTKERFRAIADYIRIHKTIPKPVVLIYRSRRVEIMDGCHRFASLFHVGVPDDYKLPNWHPVL